MFLWLPVLLMGAKNQSCTFDVDVDGSAAVHECVPGVDPDCLTSTGVDGGTEIPPEGGGEGSGESGSFALEGPFAPIASARCHSSSEWGPSVVCSEGSSGLVLSQPTHEVSQSIYMSLVKRVLNCQPFIGCSYKDVYEEKPLRKEVAQTFKTPYPGVPPFLRLRVKMTARLNPDTLGVMTAAIREVNSDGSIPKDRASDLARATFRSDKLTIGQVVMLDEDLLTTARMPAGGLSTSKTYAIVMTTVSTGFTFVLDAYTSSVFPDGAQYLRSYVGDSFSITAPTNTIDTSPPFAASSSPDMFFSLAFRTPDHAYQQLSSGEQHACAVRDDGAAFCWGANDRGQLAGQLPILGTGSVTRITSGTEWNVVEAGGFSTCGIKKDESLWCWGAFTAPACEGTPASLGNSIQPRRSCIAPGPMTVQGSTTAKWRSLSVGRTHACGIQTNGSLWCWGSNSSGQLGSGMIGTTLLDPQRVDNTTTWNSVSAGLQETTCAIRSNGSLSCWGAAREGMVGNGSTTGNVATPTQVSSSGWRSISVGESMACGLKSDGLWCWGRWPGDSSNHPTPSQIDTRTDWVSIDAASDDLCGARTDKSLWCWSGIANSVFSVAPAREGETKRWSGVALSPLGVLSHGIFALTVGGQPFGWGSDFFGQLTGTPNGWRSSPSLLKAGWSWRTVAPSDRHACGIRTDGTLWCWGENGVGQLGNGSTTASLAQPVQVKTFINPLDDGWTQIAVSDFVSCGIQNQTLWCWGNNELRQLGDDPSLGAATFSATPRRVMLGTLFKSVAVDDRHTCAVSTTGELACWGSQTPEIMDADIYRTLILPPCKGGASDVWAPCATPTKVASDFATVSLANEYGCGLRANGQVACWGDNRIVGALGVAGLSYTETPVTSFLGKKAKMVSTGTRRACAIDDTPGVTNGSLWCWFHDLPPADGLPRLENPAPFVTTVAVGTTTCAISTTGMLYCQGKNQMGQLGLGVRTEIPEIFDTVAGAFLTTWSSVAVSGNETICGTSTAGRGYCMGVNHHNMLLADTNSATPTRLPPPR